MSPFILSVLKYTLLALLYFFVYRAVRSVAADLSAPRPARSAPAPTPKRTAQKGRRAPGSVVVHAGEGARPATHRLSGPLEIGRAEGCAIRLEDTYASQHHARISSRDGAWYLEDLGSTNGTYVNDRRVQAAVEVH